MKESREGDIWRGVEGGKGKERNEVITPSKTEK